MNQQDNIESNDQSSIIEDLAAQNADEIKGGPRLQPYRFAVRLGSVADGAEEQQTVTVASSSNHNETTTTEALDDLPVEDDEQVKGGPDGGSSCPPRSCGLNHNETTVSDGEAAGQVYLADLPVADEQAEEIKSGTLSNVEYTITVTDTQTGRIR